MLLFGAILADDLILRCKEILYHVRLIAGSDEKFTAIVTVVNELGHGCNHGDHDDRGKRQGDNFFQVHITTNLNLKKSDILNEAVNQARVEEGTDLNIPKLIEVSKINNRWALVSEHIEGTTLDFLMAQNPEKEDEYLNTLNQLESWMEKYAACFDIDSNVPGCGAAGGIGYCLNIIGATLVSGIKVMLDELKLKDNEINNWKESQCKLLG